MTCRNGGDKCPLLSMNGVTKRFPGVLALADVNLSLYQGEILGLIGENGAGKSTLMNILGGIYAPDTGEVLIEGQPVKLGSVQDALAHGVAIIHQELNLAGNLDVASNIFLGREPAGNFSVVKRKKLYDEAAVFARMVGLTAPLNAVVEDLPSAQQQLVEIAKAISQSAKILVLDEPTSSLSDKETQKLFSVMRMLKEKGVSMIYISHRMREIEEMCDRALVLRDGRCVGELAGSEITRDTMVRMMVGRDISRFFPETGDSQAEEPVLSLRQVRCKACKGEFSFDVFRGEVLGVAGLVGAGRTELMRSVFGVEPVLSGEILIDGKKVAIHSPIDAIRHGIALVPEDRKELGLLLEMSIKENVPLPTLPVTPGFLMDDKRDIKLTQAQITALSIKTPSMDQAVECLSGGNQQKVVLAKWLALKPKVLILDEPTRGIDVGSKSEIYRLIRHLADDGIAIIMISSEMEEIVGLSDRVMVMHEGKALGVLNKSELCEERVMQLATGGGC